MKLKKILISLGSVGTFTLPLVAIVACSPKAKDHEDEDHNGHGITQADVDKLPKNVEITSGGTDQVIKDKIKAKLQTKVDSDANLSEEAKETFEHLIEHHFGDAALDKDAKTLTIEADGTTYKVVYTIN